MPKRILGIDTGGTMAKAAVSELDGREVGADRRANQVLFPEAGHTEVDAEGLWRAACAAVRGALAKSGTDAGDIIGVSTTGHGNGLYAVDAAGLPVAPSIISTDSPAVALGEEWNRLGHGEAAEAAIMQRFWSGQTLALLGRFKRHRSTALDRAAALFGSKDDLCGRLTGDLSTEITEAAVSGLADLTTGDYARDPFDQLGFGDVLALPIEITDSGELGAQGAAISVAAALGLFENLEAAVAGMVRVVRRYEPDAERVAVYERTFARFASLAEILAHHSAEPA